jgi:hypothetical protein
MTETQELRPTIITAEPVDVGLAWFAGLLQRARNRMTRSSEYGADAISTHYIGDELRLARGNLLDGYRFQKMPPALLTTLLTFGSMYAD